MSCGQKSVERAGRPGRLTGMAAGGSVAKLVTVSVSGQPPLAGGSSPRLAGSARLHHPGTHYQLAAGPSRIPNHQPRPSRHDQPANR